MMRLPRRRLVRRYAGFVAELMFDPHGEPPEDPVEEAVKLLRAVVSEGLDEGVSLLSPEAISAREVLEFLEDAGEEELEQFREALAEELRRLRRDWELGLKLEEELQAYGEELGVPVSVLDYAGEALAEEPRAHWVKVEIGASVYVGQFEGAFEELVDALKEAIDREAVEVRRLLRESLRARARLGRGLRRFLAEIESHVRSTAILTVAAARLPELGSLDQEGGGPRVLSWDVKRLRSGHVVYGANPALWPKFYEWLSRAVESNEVVGVTLRSFTDLVDERTGLPIKELRGYVLRATGEGDVEYRQLSAAELVQAYSRNPLTGEPLEPEPAVVYCGPGDERIPSTGGAQLDSG